MKLVCRARVTIDCEDGASCIDVYGEDSMRDDGTFDGETVVCTPCYIAIGQPSLRFPARPVEVVAAVDRALREYRRGLSK